MSKKSERLQAYHQQLQPIYETHPLARLLVESASKVKRSFGYNQSSAHYAYKDWIWAVFRQESAAFYKVMEVIDALLPESHPEHSISLFNPELPGLPPRPSMISQTCLSSSGRTVFRAFTEHDLEEMSFAEERERHTTMREQLQTLAKRHLRVLDGKGTRT